MTTGQLVLIIALVLVAAILVALILLRGSQRREEHRVEAEGVRSEAEEVAASSAGLAAFAEQSQQRAGLARSEADEKVAEAERLEAEAAQQQRAAEQSRQEYESMMRRADDIDPDVKESQYPPVREDASPEPAPADGQAGVDPTEETAAPQATGGERADEEVPMTRAERRRAREEAEARESEEAAWASGPAAPVAGAAAAAAVGTAAWAHDDDATDAERERSARIASAADYRDATDGTDATAEAAEVTGGGAAGEHEVSEPGRAGTEEDMSQQSRHETLASRGAEASDRDGVVNADAAADAESPRGEWGGPPEDAPSGTAGSVTAEDTPATEEGTTMTERPEGDESPTTTEPETDEATRAEEDAPPATDLGSGMTMVPDPDAFAATEPVLADEQAPPVEPETPEHTGPGLLDREPEGDGSAEAGHEDVPGAPADEHTRLGDAEKEGVDAVVLADTDAYASPEPVLADGSHAQARDHHHTGESAEDDRPGTIDDPGADDGIVAGDADDPGARDWAHDEEALLDENRDRGDRLAAERDALGREAGAEAAQPTTESAAASSSGEAADEAPRGRRVSDFHEIRDGGFGVGSAAPLDDGAQPMDHPVAGYRDTMTFRTPGDSGYDDVDPDVWFYDEGAAERSGFHRSEG